MDSLRYWVQEMHVDGFRFDLAPTLARNAHGAFDRNGAFLSAVRQDPVLSRVKLIAEPWDLGEGGYQLGNFPPGWAEWNDRYRDAVRAFWRGDGGMRRRARLAPLRLERHLRAAPARSPRASVNFVTAHDGFTLQDLVSYERKHNEANLEDNRDGTDNNRSWNCGVEGPTDDAAIRRAARAAEAQPPRDAASSRRACRCCSPATSSAARSAATTTPTARTTRSPGSTGSTPTRELLRIRAPR